MPHPQDVWQLRLLAAEPMGTSVPVAVVGACAALLQVTLQGAFP